MKGNGAKMEGLVPDNELTCLSTFTGLGGMDLGLEAAGFKNVGCVEWDEAARRSLKANRGTNGTSCQATFSPSPGRSNRGISAWRSVTYVCPGASLPALLQGGRVGGGRSPGPR